VGHLLRASAILVFCSGAALAQQDTFAAARSDLVSHIEQLAGGHPALRGGFEPRVLNAFRKVPRHRFVPGVLVPYAYQDMPLPLGSSRTSPSPRCSRS
jgi:hypothetical protein